MPEMDLETRKREKPHVAKEDITVGLRRLGLGDGDLVVVHSSLSAFGYVEGGADAVIDALLEAVGEQGTVVMPTFHDGKLYRSPKDPLTTPSLLGRISDTFCHRPGVLRGCGCGIAAVGPLVGEILCYAPLPSGRPRHNTFYRIAELGGYVLLLGVGQNVNSMLHTAQGLAVEETEGIVVDIYVDYDLGGGYEFLRFEDDALDKLLVERGQMKVGVIGEAQVRLIKGLGLYEVTREMYEATPAFRAHTQECLAKVAQGRRELWHGVQQLTERDREHLVQAEKLRGLIQDLRCVLMEIADKIGADRQALAQWIPDGDLRLFADQLEGRLMSDFAATLKLLQDERFARVIEKHLVPR